MASPLPPRHPPAPGSKYEKGRQAEARAAAFLSAQGYTILCQNYRWRRGEIDLVARDGTTLCFVEVRSRADLGWAAATVDQQKQRRIARSAEHYLVYAHKGPPCPCRFDVVTIEEGHRVSLFRDAFRL